MPTKNMPNLGHRFLGLPTALACKRSRQQPDSWLGMIWVEDTHFQSYLLDTKSFEWCTMLAVHPSTILTILAIHPIEWCTMLAVHTFDYSYHTCNSPYRMMHHARSSHFRILLSCLQFTPSNNPIMLALHISNILTCLQFTLSNISINFAIPINDYSIILTTHTIK